MVPIRLPLLATLAMLMTSASARADVLFDWKPDSSHLKQHTLSAAAGADGTLSDDPTFDVDGTAHGLAAARSSLFVSNSHGAIHAFRP